MGALSSVCPLLGHSAFLRASSNASSNALTIVPLNLLTSSSSNSWVSLVMIIGAGTIPSAMTVGSASQSSISRVKWLSSSARSVSLMLASILLFSSLVL